MLLAAGQDRAIHERLSAELAQVEARFGTELVSDLACVNDLVTHVERYRGKMLRPMLVIVSGLASGPTTPASSVSAEPLTEAHSVIATVVEMVHMATLVHDDILDEAEVRRQGTTVNALNGNEAAVMLGDYLISHAYHLCSSINQPRISAMIAQATNTVCEGELLQLANRNNWKLDEGTYFEIIRRKTASLTGSCCQLGAILHGANDDAAAEALYQYGERLGIAFQVVDDLLDLVGEEKTVGKSLGRDLAKGKLTLPVIQYLTKADAEKRKHMLALIANIGAESKADMDKLAMVNEARQLIMQSQAMQYARQSAQRLVDEAKASLDSLPESPARVLLAEMADMVLTRKS